MNSLALSHWHLSHPSSLRHEPDDPPGPDPGPPPLFRGPQCSLCGVVTARGPPPAGSCHRPGQAELHPQLRGPQARVVAAPRAHQAQRHHVQVIGKSGGKLLSCRIARTLCYNRYIRLLESIYDCYCVQFVISKTFCETRERVINVPRVETSLSMKLHIKTWSLEKLNWKVHTHVCRDGIEEDNLRKSRIIRK